MDLQDPGWVAASSDDRYFAPSYRHSQPLAAMTDKIRGIVNRKIKENKTMYKVSPAHAALFAAAALFFVGTQPRRPLFSCSSVFPPRVCLR